MKHQLAGMLLVHQRLLILGKHIHQPRQQFPACSRTRTLATIHAPLTGVTTENQDVENNESVSRNSPTGTFPKTIRKRSPRTSFPGRTRSQQGKDFRPKRVRFPDQITATDLFDDDGKCNVEPILLRDACDCVQCVDLSTGQRNFSFTEIPVSINAVLQKIDEDHVSHVTWENDVHGFDASHVSTFTAPRVKKLTSAPLSMTQRWTGRPLWNKAAFTQGGCWTDYEDYIGDESSLKSTLSSLHRDGLVFVRNVPSEPSAVANIAERIGPLRNTFYGSTWDVRSLPDAKNVAYTSKYLGFHMDLLYMDKPPEYQLLHCLQNSCTGGESRFVDTFQAAQILADQWPDYADILRGTKLDYVYNNDGHYYNSKRNVFEDRRGSIASGASYATQRMKHVNWSPEFMGTPGIPQIGPAPSEKIIEATRKFAEILEREDLVFQVKMDEGTCVIFENRRVAHARNAFDIQSGKRWLRGAYLDIDTFWSKLNVLGLASADGGLKH